LIVFSAFVVRFCDNGLFLPNEEHSSNE